MYIKKPVLIISVCLIVLFVMVGTIMAVNPFGPLNFSEFFKFNTGVAVLENYFYEEIDTKKLVDGALLGASYSAEDPYTVYMNKDEAESFLENVESDEYTGVGLYISGDGENEGVTVISPLADSPAEKAGIVSGDVIVKVNGESVAGKSIDQVAAEMKGPEGTNVNVTVIKKVSGDMVDIDIVRAKIERETVKSEMLDGRIAYIQISQFGINTYEEYAKHYNQLVADGMKRLILDLRNNPGGYMEIAVNIADTFIDEGEIVYTLNKDGTKRDYMATKGVTKVPMVILTNGGSASASEILVGALRDYGLATIVGEKTFGKGVTQIPYQFNDGSIMKVTDSRYYTPNGICIDHEGIMPDVEVKMSDDEYADISGIDTENDPQLKKAIEILTKK